MSVIAAAAEKSSAVEGSHADNASLLQYPVPTTWARNLESRGNDLESPTNCELHQDSFQVPDNVTDDLIGRVPLSTLRRLWMS